MAIKDYIQLLFGIRDDIKTILKTKFESDQSLVDSVTDDFTTYPDLIDKLSYAGEPTRYFEIHFLANKANTKAFDSNTSIDSNIVDPNDYDKFASMQPITECINVYYSNSINVQALKFGSSKIAGSIKMSLSSDYFEFPKKIEVDCWKWSGDQQVFLNIFGNLYDNRQEITVAAESNTTEPDEFQTIEFEFDNTVQQMTELDLSITGPNGGTSGAYRCFIKISVYTINI